MPQSPSSSSSSEAERDALLPCPFCGAPASGYAIAPHTHALRFGDFKMPDHVGSYVVEGNCSCGSGLIGATQGEVTARWNTRATPPSLPIDFKQASEQGALGGDAGVSEAPGAQQAQISDEQLDALDTFSLSTMAPRGKESVRAYGRAVLALVEPFNAEEARKRGIDYFADRYLALKAALATPAPELEEVSLQPWDWLRGVINELPSTPSGCYELIRRHDVLAWIDEGEWRALSLTSVSKDDDWLPIEQAPKDGTELLLTNGETVQQGWWMEREGGVKEHRDTDGRYLGQDEDEGYIGWWDVSGGMQPEPTRYMPLPAARSPHPEEGALLLGGDEGGKKGGA